MFTVPFGAFATNLLRFKWWQVLLFGFALSLFFEISQLTGIFGLYEYPYRLFDVDDLITNTAGAMLGFWLALPFCLLLPSIDEVNMRAVWKGSLSVSVMRRLAGLTVDVVVVAMLSLVVTVLVAPAEALAAIKGMLCVLGQLGEVPMRAVVVGMLGAVEGVLLPALAWALVFSALTFFVAPMLSGGRTLGHALTGLRVVRSDGMRAQWYAYMVRYGLLGAFLAVPLMAMALFPGEALEAAASGAGALKDVVTGDASAVSTLAAAASAGQELALEGISVSAILDLSVLLYAAWGITLLVRCVASALGYPPVMLNEVISDTRIVPERALGR